MAILVDWLGNEEEVPYFKLEEKCKEIISNLSKEAYEKFLKFKEDYHYFSPYFDFLILELGYSIKNPMGYENGCIVSKNDKICLFKNTSLEDYKQKKLDMSAMTYKSSRFTRCDDKTLSIKSCPKKREGFRNGIIDASNTFISLGSAMEVHNDLAALIVNQMIIKSEKLYQEFCNYSSDMHKEVNFLEDVCGFIRFGLTIDKLVLLTYRKSKLSKENKEYIEYLFDNNYLDLFNVDKDEADLLEKEAFRVPKK